jgi:hypothetical protein
MASVLKVDKLDPQSGTALELGTSGDTVTVPTGAGLTVVDEVKTNKISPSSGVAFTLGDSGDTFTIPSGATITNSGTATGFGGNAPAFSVRDTTQQSITDNTDTKVTWNTELYDSDSAFASDKFTVPAGEGGYYYLYGIACLDSQGSSNLNIAYLNIFVNGSRVTMSENDFRDNPLRKYNATVTTIQSLSATDYVEVYAKIDTSDAGAGLVVGDDYQQMFGGFKIG